MALRAEAWAMITSLAADCCEALRISAQDSHDDSLPRGSQEIATQEKCIPWLLRSLFSTRVKRSLTNPHVIKVLWHPYPKGRSTGASAVTPTYSIFDARPLITEPLPHTDQSVYPLVCWDPVRQQQLETRTVSLRGPSYWKVPEGNPEPPSMKTPPTVRCDGVSTETIMVPDPNLLLAQWRAAVRDADVAFLIAPQPEMQHWLTALGALSDKVLTWPVDLLARAEDKRHLTSLPSLVIEPGPDSWRFLSRETSPASASATHCDEADAQRTFQDFFANASTWALKPTNQCGGSDVWKISLAAPVSDFTIAIQIIQQLREQVPCETGSEQPLLWSPWVEGQAGSLLVLATEAGWWCCPPCRQILNFEDVPIPLQLQKHVTRLQKVQYRGAELDTLLTTNGTEDLLFRQFAANLTVAERRSIRGWFGIDFVATSHERATLIEINPRLTSSYNLLRQLCLTVE